MPARDVLKNFNLFADGRGYAGQGEEYTPPALSLVTESFRGGGMDAPVPIDMGMEALSASFTLLSYDANVLALWGVTEGNWVPLTVRGAAEGFEGTTRAIAHHMRGRITQIDSGTWQPGQKMPLSITMGLVYYKCTIDERTIHEIDIENMIRVVDGVDRLAAQREALGL